MRLDRELTCTQVVEIVTAYLEDSLLAEDRERVEEHLVFCEGCSTYLEQMRETITLTGRLEPEQIPSALQDKFLAAFSDWSPA